MARSKAATTKPKDAQATATAESKPEDAQATATADTSKGSLNEGCLLSERALQGIRRLPETSAASGDVEGLAEQASAVWNGVAMVESLLQAKAIAAAGSSGASQETENLATLQQVTAEGIARDLGRHSGAR